MDELEKLVECLNKDIEKRMKRVDEQLKKYECELCEKAKQVRQVLICPLLDMLGLLRIITVMSLALRYSRGMPLVRKGALCSCWLLLDQL